MGSYSEMTDEALTAADSAMMANHTASGARSLTDEHRAVKAELGHRNAERVRTASRARMAKKGAATRAARAAAGLPPKRRAFTFDNAPAGGWTDADRV